jgi:hypothetical protein
VAEPDILYSLVPAWQYLEHVSVGMAMLIGKEDILDGPMEVAFRHGRDAGRVRVCDIGHNVGCPLADGLSSRGDSVGASSGQQAVEDGRAEGRGEASHGVSAIGGEKNKVRQSALEKDGQQAI